MVHLVLLSGGSGLRLWPLSNAARSKQFLKVLRNDEGESVSMFQRVLKQVWRVDVDLDVTIATSIQQEASIRAQAIGAYQLVLEPQRRDTAPAIVLACSHLADIQGAGESDTVIVMPIDTYAEQLYYERIVDLDREVQDEVADIVLMGVKPTEATSKYGYVLPSGHGGFSKHVLRFVEKPDSALAAELIACGALWNCGVFAFKLGFALAVAESYGGSRTYDYLRTHYEDIPINSFDREVVERAGSVAVIPYDGSWKDLGTWDVLAAEMDDWSHGKAAVSDVKNVHIVNETNLPMVVSGLSDAVIVATNDGILACSKEASPSIKELVKQAGEKRPMYERRCWGEYRVLDSATYADGQSALVKELIISPSMQLSYQRHSHRSEIWTVIKGSGEIVLDGRVASVFPGSVIRICPMQKHAVRATDDLHIIEVQLGNPLIEEDIERFGEFWSG